MDPKKNMQKCKWLNKNNKKNSIFIIPYNFKMDPKKEHAEMHMIK